MVLVKITDDDITQSVHWPCVYIVSVTLIATCFIRLCWMLILSKICLGKNKKTLTSVTEQ
jgi:hypothetical protein